VLDSKKDEDDESDLDFGADSEDSDDDYEEGPALKPWQQKKANKSSVSRLDQMDESDDESTGMRQKSKAEAGAALGTVIPPAEKEDFAKVTIPRRRLARWVNEPFFEQAVIDSYVRLFLGEDENGEKAYRLCQIVNVKKGQKLYNFPTANRREIPVGARTLGVGSVKVAAMCIVRGNLNARFPFYASSSPDFHGQGAVPQSCRQRKGFPYVFGFRCRPDASRCCPVHFDAKESPTRHPDKKTSSQVTPQAR